MAPLERLAIQIDPEEAAEGPDTPPAIVIATEPTELIVTDGQPQFLPVGDGDLLIISNTESDVLRENTTQRIFVLLSGRWYRTKDIDNGPWTWVANDELSEQFAEIPAE